MTTRDEKTFEISLEEFFSSNNNLRNVTQDAIFDNVKTPEEYATYFKFTSRFFAEIHYTSKLVFPSLTTKPILESIRFARRDGKTEYVLLKNALEKLLLKKEKGASEIVLKRIENLDRILKLLPDFKSEKESGQKTFEDFLVKTGKNFDVPKYKKKIIVFDTETNGTRTKHDDLLSISIYDPSSGICYNRFLPLELQPIVLTTNINGITEKDLESQTHLTQEEVDKIIKYFDLNNAFVLSYSGGQGKFDSSFINNYCKRHKLHGFENLDYVNIKSCLPRVPFGSEGQLTKDNLCRIFKIKGVDDVHSSMNDCILEYQLFDKLLHGNIFFIGHHIFAYHPEYIIPVSYLNNCDLLAKYAKIDLKPLTGNVEKIYEYKLPDNVAKEVRQFPTNITGITIENAINHLLNVEKQHNEEFLALNKSHLEYVGPLDTKLIEIPVITDDDGTIQTTDQKFSEYVNEVNRVTKIISDNLTPAISFIKENIFKTNNIMSQELVISDDKKVLSLCDLSDQKSVLEIKTYNVLTEEGFLNPKITRQLYYQNKGRTTYAMSIVIKEESNFNRFLIIQIYKVNIEEKELPKRIIERNYTSLDISVYNSIKKNPEITIAEICFCVGTSQPRVSNSIWLLKRLNVIEVSKKGRKNIYKIKKNIDKNSTYCIERDIK